MRAPTARTRPGRHAAPPELTNQPDWSLGRQLLQLHPGPLSSVTSPLQRAPEPSACEVGRSCRRFVTFSDTVKILYNRALHPGHEITSDRCKWDATEPGLRTSSGRNRGSKPIR